MSIDFHKLRVAEVKRETPDAVSVRFELPEELRVRLAQELIKQIEKK